jgi:hypothetical protein
MFLPRLQQADVCEGLGTLRMRLENCTPLQLSFTVLSLPLECKGLLGGVAAAGVV